MMIKAVIDAQAEIRRIDEDCRNQKWYEEVPREWERSPRELRKNDLG